MDNSIVLYGCFWKFIPLADTITILDAIHP